MGVMNTQSIVSNDNNTQLYSMNKRILSMMKHYRFRQRLENKCEAKYVHYAEVDEKFTSKLCIVCGSYKNQGDSEIYKCLECGLIIDRDVVGSSGILLKETIIPE